MAAIKTKDEITFLVPSGLSYRVDIMKFLYSDAISRIFLKGGNLHDFYNLFERHVALNNYLRFVKFAKKNEKYNKVLSSQRHPWLDIEQCKKKK